MSQLKEFLESNDLEYLKQEALTAKADAKLAKNQAEFFDQRANDFQAASELFFAGYRPGDRLKLRDKKVVDIADYSSEGGHAVGLPTEPGLAPVSLSPEELATAKRIPKN